MKTAKDYRDSASDHLGKAQESYERSDTDGFASQYCHGLSAGLDRAKAEIIENGGKAEFPALFDLNGNRVKAKLINGVYGECWMLLDEDDKVIKFVSAFPKRESTMSKKGFKEGKELAEAWACHAGGGKGMAGLVGVYVKVFRKDGGYPEGSVVVE